MRRAAFPILLLAAGLAAAPARAEGTDVPDIPFTRKVLGNGLVVIVHEDRKAPIVAVSVWYHVGSKNEKPGRTGFAHLFEHLMFNGSENANTDWFRPMNAMGATALNGTTNEDRTNYFQTVPKGALDATLWLESDRMGHLLGAIDQGKLDEQRGVVQNEKRQGENRPYSAARRLLPSLLFPAGHPYSWQVIGSMEDLDAASLDDVKEWFRAYYGAANAVVVICGDVDAAEATKKVEHYFGDIPPGPPVVRPGVSIAKRTGTTRAVVEERVPAGQVLRVWNTPQWGSEDAALLELAASVLGRGPGSRLASRLVRKDGIATEASASSDASEIAGTFSVSATAAPGAALAAVEKAAAEEVARFLAEGPTEDELAVERTQERAEFLRRTERMGGFGGKTAYLAYSELYGGRPDAWRDRFAILASATPAAVRDAARRWLADGDLVVETRPFPRHAPSKEGADRSAMPAVTPSPKAEFPALARTALPNGLKIVVARRTSVPLVRIDLLVDAGFAADALAAPGTAQLAGRLLAQGTASRSEDEIRREFERLGADFGVETETDTTRLSVSVPRDGLAACVTLLAEVAQRPSFPAEAVEVQRRAQLAAIQEERVDGRGISQRVLPRLLYGEGHPYAAPSSGSGTSAAVSTISREDLQTFHRLWFVPSNATLAVTGDASIEEIAPIATAAFGGWKGEPAPAKRTAGGAPPAKSRVYIVDRPNAPQSVLVGAQLVPARSAGSEMPLEVMNTVLGGGFVSRLNMNLREDKHWSYGARTAIRATRGQRTFSAFAPVQTDRTAESLAEMVKEVRGIAGGVPATEKEIAAAKSAMTLTLPGRWEATRAVADSVAEIVAFGLPDDWFDGYAARILAVGEADVAAAGAALRPDEFVWLVIGDRKKVEKSVRELGIGEVAVIDAEGRPAE